MKKILAVVLCMVATPILAGGGSNASQASVNLARQGLGQMIQGSATVLQAGSELTVTSAKNVGQFVYVTLKSATDANVIVIKVSTPLAGAASVAIGQSIEVVTTASGYLLKAGDKAFAFVPNNMGKDLIYSNEL